MALDDAIYRLSSGKGSIRCHEVISILEELGFMVKECKKPGHYVYGHEGLDHFWGSDFCCPHRSGNPVLKNYITKILGVLRQYETELSLYLGDKDD